MEPGTKIAPPRRRRTRAVRFELSPATLVALVLVPLLLWLLIQLEPVLLVLVFALFTAGTMSPAIRWLEARGVRRGLGIGFVFAMVFIAAFLAVTLTIPALVAQAADLFEREPAFRAGLADRLARFSLSAPFAGWLRTFRYDAQAGAMGASALTYSVRVLRVAAYGVSAIFLALYMMIDRDRLRGGLFALVPRSHHIRLSRVMMNLETIVGGYIRGQLITSLLMGAFIFILLKACGVENAMALAVFAGVADVLPYIGNFIAAAPAAVAVYVRNPAAAIAVLALMLAYGEFESRVLVPRIYGRILRLPSSVILFALLAGVTLMGLSGALLALPVAAAAMMLIEELRVDLPGEHEQAADAALRAGDNLAEIEYERRAEGVPAEKAAAIAVEISMDRKSEEPRLAAEKPPQTLKGDPSARIERDAAHLD
ncbi:MAG TPA: AI-2E family transporter [Holophagaceae bacterium]|nr:AI-2E family transporter [Holophagaceae bacterium]